MEKIFLVGVTGNFGSGKTTVCKIFEQQGYPVIYSDSLAKEVLKTNPNVKNQVISTFGSESYFDNGEINTTWLAQKVFSDTPEGESNLAFLNSIVHPAVLDEIEKIISELILNGAKIIFIESALIFEIGIEEIFDYIILVDASKDTIINRMNLKGVYSEEEVLKRLKKQMPSEEKRKLADFVIYNEGSFDELSRNVGLIITLLEGMRTSKKSKV
ncbi:MAG: dephospho-CoA kinase [Ignavibacteria bacterium]|nr:dephospho-CoA kinase [Ignavibacteria bacterium]